MNVRCHNILRTYHQATADEMHAGLTWYRQANEEADRLAESYTLPIASTAAIIAALSPGLRWESNVEAAERVIRGVSLKGLGVRFYDGVHKGRRIKRGHNPDVVLRGNKVKSFYSNILNPTTSMAVCVDVHCYSVWAGKRVTSDEVPAINNRLYHRIANDYVIVAKELGLTPCQTQAIVWVAHRRLHGVVKSGEST